MTQLIFFLIGWFAGWLTRCLFGTQIRGACCWTYTGESWWRSGCGEVYSCDESGLEDDDVAFCQFCGKVLVAIKENDK